MQVSLQTFTSLINDMKVAVQARSASAKLATGSAVMAILEATGSAAIWLELIALQVLTATRLSTSFGADVDSFLAIMV